MKCLKGGENFLDWSGILASSDREEEFMGFLDGIDGGNFFPFVFVGGF
jgi:hypothetical protein